MPTIAIPQAVQLRLVLIEDHQALLEGLELLLGREGCDVVGTAGTAAEGRRLVEELAPDVALVDIRLGEDDGIALTRTCSPRIPSGAWCSTPAPPTRSCCSAGWTPARRLRAQGRQPARARRRAHAGRRGRQLRRPAAAPALLSRRATERLPSLSNREREILDLLAQGLTGEAVAEHLLISAETVKTHIRNAMNKLEAHTRVHAIAIALREGYISPPADEEWARCLTTPRRSSTGCATTCARRSRS